MSPSRAGNSSDPTRSEVLLRPWKSTPMDSTTLSATRRRYEARMAYCQAVVSNSIGVPPKFHCWRLSSYPKDGVIAMLDPSENSRV